MKCREKTISSECKSCGISFLAVPYEITRGGGKFCGRVCQRTWQAKTNASAKKGVSSVKGRVAGVRVKPPKQVTVAQHAVWQALKTGKLLRGKCEVCGSDKVDGHHDDYSKPLEVRWLCRSHHLQFHRKKQQENAT